MGEHWEEQMRACRICPRECGVDRWAVDAAGAPAGRCGCGAALRAARAALHHWEEPCLSGSNGSGAIFFVGCSLGCVFCQNREISHLAGRDWRAVGKEITIDRLTELCLELAAQGAHNINLVTGTHFTPQIAQALRQARRQGLDIPVVWTSSGYEKAETLRQLEGLVDIYLPDFKFFAPEMSERYAYAADFFPAAAAALAEMLRQQPQPVFARDGMMQRGVLVRHLVLPGQYNDSRDVIQYLYQNYGDSVYLSLMNQYTPLQPDAAFPELQEPVSAAVYDQLIDYALLIGLKNGFIQEEGTVAESFIPRFDGEGL